MRKAAVILIITLSVCCKSKKALTNKNTMENFNIIEFNSQEKNNEVNNISENGILIRQIRYENIFVEEKRDINSPLLEYKSYFIETGSLKSIGKQFYFFNTGIWNEYDENGNLIQSKDWDENYHFSISDLAQKIANLYNVDILDINQKNIVVRGYENLYYYDVSIPISPMGKSDRRVIRVDGTNGNIISDKINVYKQ
jgi:hypothetical protein